MVNMRTAAGLAIAAVLLSVYTPAGAAASDAAQEKLWADAVQKILQRGEAVWLQTADSQQKVFAVYTQDMTGKRNGGLIILHDLGQHPDWPEVVAALRSRLPDHGWSTLSVQMPILGRDQPLDKYGPLFDDVAPRLQSAIAYLKDKHIDNIVLIGYGLGAAMGAAFLAANPVPDIKGFIAVSMGALKGLDPRMYTPASLAKIKVPILDIYGSRDFERVVSSAPLRADAARKAGADAERGGGLAPSRHTETAESPFTRKSGYLFYRQVEIDGADHYYSAMTDVLVTRIVGWLDDNAAPAAQSATAQAGP